MNIVCPSCQSRYRFDESKLGDRPRARTRCTKCGGAIEIVNPKAAGAPKPSGTQKTRVPELPPPRPTAGDQPTTKRTAVVPRAEQTNPGVTGQDVQHLLELPKDRRFSLAIIQGAATGQIHAIEKVRTTIGRMGQDIDLDDPEASRLHATVEILGEHAVLRDAGSTNGTFVDGNRIEHEVLANHTEFRIGGHVLMFIVTQLE